MKKKKKKKGGEKYSYLSWAVDGGAIKWMLKTEKVNLVTLKEKRMKIQESCESVSKGGKERKEKKRWRKEKA